MKKSILLSLIIFILASSLNAQNDTMYLIKSGVIVGRYSVKTDIDSIIFYKPSMQSANSFTDSRDGNIYRTVTIEGKVWMAENLKYLPNIVGPQTGSLWDPYYYVYGYDGTNLPEAKATANYQTYGVLYNWEAAKIACPSGWHLPSNDEWIDLTNYLGGEGVAGGKLKEKGTTHWDNPNTGATDEINFTARPGGYRGGSRVFDDIGGGCYWWSSSYISDDAARDRAIGSLYVTVSKYTVPTAFGFSVRCLKN